MPEWPARNCPPLVRFKRSPGGQEAGGWVTGSGGSGLEEETAAGIANEFRMEKGRLLIPVRQAMMPYLETALGLAPAEGMARPPRLERLR